MQLRRIALSSFRNYDELDLGFTSGLNIFVGNNAQGKTNLLEAIYLLSLGRSFRTTDDVDLIGWNKQLARVRAEVERETGEARIDIMLRRDGPKQVRVAGEKLNRIADLIGTVNTVIFAPDDLQLVKGSPGMRRRFLDAEIAQISPLYRHHFLRYQRILRQRNNLLKSIRAREAPKSVLEPWDVQLVTEGVIVAVKRAETVRRLATWAKKVHGELTGGRERLNLVYRPFFAAENEMPIADWESRGYVHDRFERAMTERRGEELARAVTLVGPQRDDIAFMIGDVDARSFASQGQQRSAVLATKLAEIEFFKEEIGEYPILLLDDVMSELDDDRRAYFLNHVSGRVNTFITTTNVRSFKPSVLNTASVFEIQRGTVSLTK